MLGLFKSKSLLDPDTVDWIFAMFSWALRNFGTDVFYDVTILVTPSNRHFPDKVTEPGEVAVSTFQRVRAHAGMDQWQCTLIAQEPDTDTRIGATISIENAPRGPAGTFSVSRTDDDKSKVVISFNPELVRYPEALVATFAHELAHYLAATCQELSPGGEEYHEHATDLLAVFLGFGIFQANNAFHFQQFTDGNLQGWSYRRLGYLSQYELVYTLALFCALKEINYKTVHRYLKDPLCSYYKKAIKEIRMNPKLEELKMIKSIKNQLVTD